MLFLCLCVQNFARINILLLALYFLDTVAGVSVCLILSAISGWKIIDLARSGAKSFLLVAYCSIVDSRRFRSELVDMRSGNIFCRSQLRVLTIHFVVDSLFSVKFLCNSQENCVIIFYSNEVQFNDSVKRFRSRNCRSSRWWIGIDRLYVSKVRIKNEYLFILL